MRGKKGVYTQVGGRVTSPLARRMKVRMPPSGGDIPTGMSGSLGPILDYASGQVRIPTTRNPSGVTLCALMARPS